MNHLVIILHDNHVSFRTTEGRTGSNPLDLCRDHHALADYFTTIIPHDTFEVIDDRTVRLHPEPEPDEVPAWGTLIAQCTITALILFTIIYLATKHL
jgi:hypothetical protein